MKIVNVKIYTKNEIAKSLQVITKDGQPTVIKADKHVNYEFFDQSIGRAPNHIITKRVGKNLHVSFEKEGVEDDLIIEEFYTNDEQALIGIAEDGNYYYYVPDTGEVADYVTQLPADAVEGQALGGENLVAPWWVAVPTGFPWWLVGGIVPFLIDKDDPTPTPQPSPTITGVGKLENLINANKTLNTITSNLADSANGLNVALLDKNVQSTLVLSYNGQTAKVGEALKVENQGEYRLAIENGVPKVTFTPIDTAENRAELRDLNNINFSYTANGKQLTAEVDFKYIANDTQRADSTLTEIKPTTVNLFEPDNKSTNTLGKDADSVAKDTLKLYHPDDKNHTNPLDKVVVQGEGTWTINDDKTVTFTPDAGFNGQPTPIEYSVQATVKDKTGNPVTNANGQPFLTEKAFATVEVYHAIAKPDLVKGDFDQDNKPTATTIEDVTKGNGSDKGVDPATVKLINPKTGEPTTSVTVDGQGTWTQDPNNKAKVTFTPQEGFVGNPTPINYIATDIKGNPIPETPVAVVYNQLLTPDTKIGEVGKPVTIKVTDNDVGVDINTLKLVDPKNNTPKDEVPVENGTWKVVKDPNGKPTGDVIFTPNTNFTGKVPPINYEVVTTGGKKQTEINVSYPNDNKIVTTPDSKPGEKGTPVTVNVTDNDGNVDPRTVKLIDPNDPTATPTNKITIPNEGTWTVNSNGSITFTPNNGFTADPIPVNYVVGNKDGTISKPTPINITYPTSNDVTPPIAVNDSITTTEDNPTTGNLMDNDTAGTSPNLEIKDFSVDINGDGTAETFKPSETAFIKDKDGNPIGELTIKPNGEYNFVPAKNWSGKVPEISYTLIDGNGKEDPAKVEITVTPVADSPVATPDEVTEPFGTPVVTIPVLDNDKDPDTPKEDLTVTLVDPNNPTTPTDSVTTPDGVWTVTPDNKVTFTPVKGFTGEPKTPIQYIVKDKEGNVSTPTSIKVTIGEAGNQSPVAEDNAKSGKQGEVVTGNVLTDEYNGKKDSDPDNDPLQVTEFNVNGQIAQAGQTVNIPNVGEFTIAKDGSYSFTPDKNFTGDSLKVSYTIKDRDVNGLTDSAELNIKITAKPLTTKDEGEGKSGEPITVPVLDNDKDPDTPKEDLTVTLVDPTKPNTPTDSVTTPDGVWTVTTDNKVTFTPNPDFSGKPTVPVNYIVTDKDGNVSDPTPIDITIADKGNEAPNAKPNEATGLEDRPIKGNVILDPSSTGEKDSDPEGKELTVTEFNVNGKTTPAGETVSVTDNNGNPVGELRIDKNGDYSFTPSEHYNGELPNISYTVTDGQLTSTANLKLTVTPVNDTPDADDNVIQVMAGKSLGLGLQNPTDPDTKLEDMTIVVTKLPTEGSVKKEDGTTVKVGDALTAKELTSLVYEAPKGFEGDAGFFEYTVTDDTNLTDTGRVMVNVEKGSSPSIKIPNDPANTPTNPGVPETPETPVSGEPKPVDPKAPSDPNTPEVATPGHEGNTEGKGDDSVVEGEKVAGSFTITSNNGIADITINGTSVKDAKANPVVIETNKGSIKVTDVTDGKVSYEYTAKAQTHGKDSPIVIDNLAVVAKDDNGVTTTASLDIAIIDGKPAAKNDTGSVDNAGTAKGNVTENDAFGVDGKGKPTVTKVEKEGQYGSIVIEEDGSYTYTLNKDKLNAAIAGGEKPTTDNFEYTITDKDGDTSKATLKVTVPSELPKVSIATNQTMNETDGSTVAHTISLEKPATAPVMVKFKVEPTGIEGDKPATYGQDYILEAPANAKVVIDNAGNGTVTFETGDQNVNINVKVKGDDVYEGKETFKIVIEKPADNSYLIDSGSVTDAIFDDGTTDGITPATDNDKPTLSVSDPVVTEGTDAHAVFTLTLSNPVVQPLTLALALADGTATQNTDYQPTYEVSTNGGQSWESATSVTIPANSTSVQVRVPVVNDEVLEPQEKFTLTVTDSTNTLKVAQVVGTATINDDDKTPNITPITDPKDPANTDLAGYNEVVEATSNPVNGEMTITNPISVASVAVKGVDITNVTTKAVEIVGAEGKLVITGYDKTSGKITYTYTEDGQPNDHKAGDNSVLDRFDVQITDTLGKASTKPLLIRITDTAPTANADSDTVQKLATTTSVGNVIKGTGGNVGTATLVADDAKDNATLTQVGDIKVTQNDSETMIAGTYGKLYIKKDGSYRYELDKNDPQTQALATGTQANEVFNYTLTDQDGDSSNATLTIKVIGGDEPKLVANPNVDTVTEGTTARVTSTARGKNLLTDDTKAVPTDNLTLTKLVPTTANGAEVQVTSTTKDTLITGKYGTLKVRPNGYYIYDLDNTKPEVNNLNEGDTLQEVFTYTTTDGKTTDSSTLTITINGVSDSVVDLSGPATVLESAGDVTYTFTLKDGAVAPAGGVKIKYKVKADTARGANSAENEDITGGLSDTTEKEVTIQAGQTSATVNVNIVNDTKYEGRETYVVEMTSVEGATKGISTITTAINDFDGEDESKKDKASIQLDPPAHVSEEGLTDAKGNVIGNKDNSSAQHKNNTRVTANNKGNADYDVTNDTTTTGKIRLTNVDANDAKTIAGLQIDMNTDTKLTAKQLALTWKSTETTDQKVWTASNKDGDAIVVTFNKTGKNVGGNAEFDYTVKLLRPIDHPTKGDELNGEDNLPISFNIAVKEGDKNLTTQATTVVVVEDDAPIAVEAVHVVDVPKDVVKVQTIHTGFKDNQGVNVAGFDTDVEADGFEKISWKDSAYILSPDKEGIKTTNFTEEFELGTFSHENRTASGRLYSTTLEVSFDVNVNQNANPMQKQIELYHFETVNRNISENNQVFTEDDAKTGGTANDFVIFKNPNETKLIDGKRYSLQIQAYKKNPNGSIDENPINTSLENFKIAKQALSKQKDFWGTQYWDKKKEADIEHLKKLLGYDGAEGEITEDKINNGEYLIIQTTEPEQREGVETTSFVLKAKMKPLDEDIKIDNNLEVAGKLKKGSELPGNVVWTTTDADVTNQGVDADDNGNKVFESKYGKFTANKDGSYQFVAAKDIDRVVDLRNTNEELQFSYVYTDQDGDKAENKVIIKINDYEQQPNARVMKPAQAKDTNDTLKGTKESDVLLGGKGDDTLEGFGGADTLNGGEGNDYFLPSFRTNASGNIMEDTIIGGVGYDTLLLNPQPYIANINNAVETNGNFSTNSFVNKVTGIEEINMTNNIEQTLTIKASDVLSISENKELFVKGDSTDTVNIDKAYKEKTLPNSDKHHHEGFKTYFDETTATYLYIENELKIV